MSSYVPKSSCAIPHGLLAAVRGSQGLHEDWLKVLGAVGHSLDKCPSGRAFHERAQGFYESEALETWEAGGGGGAAGGSARAHSRN